MVKELRLAGVSSITVANAWLPVFITAYNTRFGRDPANTKDLHRPLAQTDDLDEILAWQEERTVTRRRWPGHQSDFHADRRVAVPLWGPQEVGMPHVRPLGDKLWEMRLRDAGKIAWAIYFTTSGRRIVVLHAFEKLAQQHPSGPLIWRSGGCRSFC
jgi:hypothetical protein